MGRGSFNDFMGDDELMLETFGGQSLPQICQNLKEGLQGSSECLSFAEMALGLILLQYNCRHWRRSKHSYSCYTLYDNTVLSLVCIVLGIYQTRLWQITEKAVTNCGNTILELGHYKQMLEEGNDSNN